MSIANNFCILIELSEFQQEILIITSRSLGAVPVELSRYGVPYRHTSEAFILLAKHKLILNFYYSAVNNCYGI